jgi:hypothetical protein
MLNKIKEDTELLAAVVKEWRDSANQTLDSLVELVRDKSKTLLQLRRQAKDLGMRGSGPGITATVLKE